MKKHRNIPIFVPHLGCPNTCVFCNQRKISGCEKADFSAAEREIEEALATIPAGTDVQIAFFGGSFTGIDREDMLFLLETAKKYIDAGKVGSIRLSTRPDYIDEEILDILARYGVRSIELGIQSMCDDVLAASGRGHTSAQTERACNLICERGFELVGQMMTGLPGSTLEKDKYTAEKICQMGACGARIYPTVVFRGTELEAMMARGEYESREMEKVIAEGAELLEIFARNRVKIIRIGLQASELLTDGGETASPYHEATGELIWSRYFRNEAEKALSGEETAGKCAYITVPRGSVSKMTGQKKANTVYLKEKFSLAEIKVRESEELSGEEIEINLEERKRAYAT
ncbi:MAG: radical SAM protein [Clostridia bacterium]|nr:radical SAM protein [Clostridia bacterium]